MEKIVPSILLVIGMIILIKSADVFVNSSARLSRLLGLTEIYVGLVIVSIATSFPEFSVSFLSALEHEMDISLGNVFGTTIANICLGFGLALLVKKSIPTDKYTIYNTIFMLFSAILCIAYAFKGQTSKIDGIILLTIFFIYLYFISKNRQDQTSNEISQNKANKQLLLKSVLEMLVGLVGIFISAKIVIWSVINIATVFGVSKHLISATIIAVGTSIPEIVTSIIATYRRFYGISLGTIIGSNIVDTLFIIGFSSLFVPVYFTSLVLSLDVQFYIIISVVLLIMIYTGKNLSKREGIFLLCMYIIYLYTIIQY